MKPVQKKSVPNISRERKLLLKDIKQNIEHVSDIQLAASIMSGNKQGKKTSIDPVRLKWITGGQIKAMQKRLGLNRAAFSSLVGVSEAEVARWENTRGRLKIENRDSIVSLLLLRHQDKEDIGIDES